MLLQSLAILLCPNDVVYSNLQTATTSAGKNFASPVTIWAQQLTIQNAFRGITGTSVNLRLGSTYSGAADFNVFLARDATGTPDAIVGVLGGGNWQDLTTNANGAWNQSGTVNFADQAAGQYWLMVESVGGSSVFQWSYGANTSAGQTAYFNGTAWTYPNNNNSLGAYVETVAVPEPGNFVMGVVAAVAGCLFWFFRLF